MTARLSLWTAALLLTAALPASSALAQETFDGHGFGRRVAINGQGTIAILADGSENPAYQGTGHIFYRCGGSLTTATVLDRVTRNVAEVPSISIGAGNARLVLDDSNRLLVAYQTNRFAEFQLCDGEPSLINRYEVSESTEVSHDIDMILVGDRAYYANIQVTSPNFEGPRLASFPLSTSPTGSVITRTPSSHYSADWNEFNAAEVRIQTDDSKTRLIMFVRTDAAADVGLSRSDVVVGEANGSSVTNLRVVDNVFNPLGGGAGAVGFDGSRIIVMTPQPDGDAFLRENLSSDDSVIVLDLPTGDEIAALTENHPCSHRILGDQVNVLRVLSGDRFFTMDLTDDAGPPCYAIWEYASAPGGSLDPFANVVTIGQITGVQFTSMPSYDWNDSLLILGDPTARPPLDPVDDPGGAMRGSGSGAVYVVPRPW